MMCQTKCMFLTLRSFRCRTPNNNNKQHTDVPCCVLQLARAASSGIEVPKMGKVLLVVVFRGVVSLGVDFLGVVFCDIVLRSLPLMFFSRGVVLSNVVFDSLFYSHSLP